MYNGHPVPGSLDYWVICDDTHCYLFYTDDAGGFWYSRTTIDEFPNNMSGPVHVLQEDMSVLFEGSATYKIKGQEKYLTIIEGTGSTRTYNAWTADRLDGEWVPMENANGLFGTHFTSSGNTTFGSGNAWTVETSHGELLRDGYDEKMVIDVCNLRLLFQGMNPQFSGDYHSRPYRLGLLTYTE